MSLTRIFSLIRHALEVFRAPATPWYVKMALAAGLLYALSPWDLIPEWVPVVGVLDDLALAAILISWAATFPGSGTGPDQRRSGK